MDQELQEQEWEKIRWQLGQIIKSWSKVERVITENYVAYAVNREGKETVFCFLYDDKLLLHFLTPDMKQNIVSKFEQEDLHIPFDVEIHNEFVIISLEKYRFTEVIPFIEPVYRRIILNEI